MKHYQLAALVAGLGLAANAAASPLTTCDAAGTTGVAFTGSLDGDGNHLNQLFGNWFGGAAPDVCADQVTPDEIWNTLHGEAPTTLVVEIAGNKNKNQLGTYQIGDLGSFQGLIDAEANTGDTGFITYMPGVDFGFALNTPSGTTFYSESGLNPGGYDHMVTYLNSGEDIHFTVDGKELTWWSGAYLMAWEDLGLGQRSDWDFNDLIAIARHVEPVPAPAALGLLGGGLLLVGFMRRRIAGSRA